MREEGNKNNKQTNKTIFLKNKTMQKNPDVQGFEKFEL